MHAVQTAVKRTAYILIVLILIFALCSIAAMLHTYNCTSEECEICIAISRIQDVFEGILLAVGVVSISHRIVSMGRDITKSSPIAIFSNLVSLKVKLSE
ncbi:MAG: hypothetical protein ACI3W5_01255 [Faecousia sp.]